MSDAVYSRYKIYTALLSAIFERYCSLVLFLQIFTDKTRRHCFTNVLNSDVTMDALGWRRSVLGSVAYIVDGSVDIYYIGFDCTLLFHFSFSIYLYI